MESVETTNQTSKIIAYWLLLGCFLVVAMVVIGGITRLTHSGLSMVTWEPISGTIPPLNETEWMAEFDNYKTSPEFKKINYYFDLEDFKSIFWWEYIHRALGRLIGLVFLIPFLIFWKKGMLHDKKLMKHLWIIFFLGGLQGLIGWFMVYSGLQDRPSVSHYRLALHLVTALSLFCYILWVALKIFYPKESLVELRENKIRKLLFWILGLVGLQIIYGALVAGLKAGSYYGTFPMMGDEWIPEIVGNSFNDYGLMTLFDHGATVQLIHRWLAVLVSGVIIYTYVVSRQLRLSNLKSNSLSFLLLMVIVQFTLGVYTLLYAVPVSLGVIHQLGALALLTGIIISIFHFKPSKIGA